MWQHTAVGGRALRHGSWKAEGQRKVGSASLTDYGQPPGSPVTGGLLWCKWDASSSWEACEVLWAPFRAAHSCSVHSCSQTVNAPLTLSIKHALLFPAFLLLSFWDLADSGQTVPPSACQFLETVNSYNTFHMHASQFRAHIAFITGSQVHLGSHIPLSACPNHPRAMPEIARGSPYAPKPAEIIEANQL